MHGCRPPVLSLRDVADASTEERTPQTDLLCTALRCRQLRPVEQYTRSLLLKLHGSPEAADQARCRSDLQVDLQVCMHLSDQWRLHVQSC